MSEDDATSAAAMGGNVLTPYGATLTAPVGLGGGRCVSPRFSRCSSTNSSLISFPGTAGMGGGLGLNAMTHGCPGMTYREAFDYLKQRKTDVNPNIGFVLALRELAGGVDFNLSTSV